MNPYNMFRISMLIGIAGIMPRVFSFDPSNEVLGLPPQNEAELYGAIKNDDREQCKNILNEAPPSNGKINLPFLNIIVEDEINYMDAGSNIIDFEDTPLLNLAAFHGAHNIVQFLITEKNADPNARDENGNAALHAAAAGDGSVDIVTTLLQHNANVNAKNSDQKTPVTYAIYNPRSQSADILRNIVTSRDFTAQEHIDRRQSPSPFFDVMNIACEERRETAIIKDKLDILLKHMPQNALTIISAGGDTPFTYGLSLWQHNKASEKAPLEDIVRYWIKHPQTDITQEDINKHYKTDVARLARTVQSLHTVYKHLDYLAASLP